MFAVSGNKADDDGDDDMDDSDDKDEGSGWMLLGAMGLWDGRFTEYPTVEKMGDEFKYACGMPYDGGV